MPWRVILESSWLKWVGGGVIGLTISVASSLTPDLFWLHDNRQAISILVASEPMMQRDIAELKNGMSELNVTIKELTVELQKRNNPPKIIFSKTR